MWLRALRSAALRHDVSFVATGDLRYILHAILSCSKYLTYLEAAFSSASPRCRFWNITPLRQASKFLTRAHDLSTSRNQILDQKLEFVASRRMGTASQLSGWSDVPFFLYNAGVLGFGFVYA